MTTSRLTARRERGSILVMALMIVTIGTLVGTSVIYYAGSDRRAADMGVRRVQARAMAWSGVQVIMTELAEQREALLSGEVPTITETWIAPDEAGAAMSTGKTPRWGFRAVVVANRTLWSEMGKLDVNTAPAEVLAKLPGMNEELAGKIVSARANRRFTSVAELLTVPGMSYAMLFGASDEPGELPGAAASPAADDADRPLSTYLTVYSFDPEVQVGIGAKADESAGKQRININVEWSEELGKAIEDRFDRNVADGVKSLIERGEKFEKPSSIVKKLREMRVEPEGWVEVLDAFTTNPDQYRLGAVDLLSAPAAVLACLPGMTPEAADEIVARREKLDSARRGTVAWPVLEEILTPEEFELAVDFVTSRSLQWRVVIEGGLFPETGELGGGAGGAGGPDWEQPAATSAAGSEATARPEGLRDRVVLEAVVDVSSLRARVAYLRDVSFLPTAKALAATDGTKDREQGDQSANENEESHEDPVAESSPDAFHTELNTSTLDMDRPLGEDGSGELDLPDLSGSETEGDEAGTPSDTGDERRTESGQKEPPPPPRPHTPQDKRLGRWTTGSGGSPR